MILFCTYQLNYIKQPLQNIIKFFIKKTLFSFVMFIKQQKVKENLPKHCIGIKVNVVCQIDLI